MRLALLALLLLPVLTLSGAEPRVLDSRYQLELVASEPQIVTPVAIAFDRAGRLLVIESHTHQRPDDYQGPPADRIRCFTDADHDGRFEQVTTFYEGSSQTMSLAQAPEGQILVATRREIFRLSDADNDGKADGTETLVRLVTKGDYPHNGLAGLTFDRSGQLYFGLGENLGERYELVGSDGTSISGGGEGGSVYRCSAAGTHLVRVATGVWNPFGNCFDPHGRLFSVDNDPDASPPCRLLRIVPTADFGYQFRYGRSGRHPLQAWNGEFPGTLPMTAGTGEAPCQVVAHRGRLWVTSWGDHRLETYTIQPQGAGCQAAQEVIVQGDADFRPVGLAIGPDGSVYFSDWVDRSYPVHGRGRLWRLSLRPGQADSPPEDFPPLSSDERLARQLHRQPTLDGLASDDPFLRQAAIYGWTESPKLASIRGSQLPKAAQRLGILQAKAWHESPLPTSTIRVALDDPSDDVRMFALRLVADGRRHELHATVEQIVRSESTSPRVWRAAVATMNWLADGEESKDTSKLNDMLASVVSDPAASNIQRLRALRYLPPDHAALDIAALRTLFNTPTLRGEIVDVLAHRSDAESGSLLAAIADDDRYSVKVRADALAALAAHREIYSQVFERLAHDDRHPTLRREAQRGLRDKAVQQQQRPAATDIDGWLAAVDRPGDASAGRRVFFRSVGGRCSQCHRYQERGAAVGPELTTIHRRGTRRWLLESILTPNREVAPQFTSVALIRDDGQTFSGLAAGGPADTGQEVLLKTDGTKETIELSKIVQRHVLSTSIMPTGLGEILTVDEMTDLLAFLLDSGAGD